MFATSGAGVTAEDVRAVLFYGSWILLFINIIYNLLKIYY